MSEAVNTEELFEHYQRNPWRAVIDLHQAMGYKVVEPDGEAPYFVLYVPKPPTGKIKPIQCQLYPFHDNLYWIPRLEDWLEKQDQFEKYQRRLTLFLERNLSGVIEQAAREKRLLRASAEDRCFVAWMGALLPTEEG